MDLLVFFDARHIKGDGCWVWTGNHDSNGYGRVPKYPGYMGAHRVAYELFVGPIPGGMDIEHRCHTDDASCSGGTSCLHRSCVNPHHLEVVTRVENIRRGRGFNAVNREKTTCDHGHEFTPENTYIRPTGFRDCRACGRERVRRYKERKAAA
jgi:hypothetical protein